MIATVIMRATTRLAHRTARIRLNQASGSVIGASGRARRTVTATDPCRSAIARLKTALDGVYDRTINWTARATTHAMVAQRPPTSTRATTSASSASDHE